MSLVQVLDVFKNLSSWPGPGIRLQGWCLAGMRQMLYTLDIEINTALVRKLVLPQRSIQGRYWMRLVLLHVILVLVSWFYDTMISINLMLKTYISLFEWVEFWIQDQLSNPQQPHGRVPDPPTSPPTSTNLSKS
jgi:hypothetical protein